MSVCISYGQKVLIPGVRVNTIKKVHFRRAQRSCNYTACLSPAPSASAWGSKKQARRPYCCLAWQYATLIDSAFWFSQGSRRGLAAQKSATVPPLSGFGTGATQLLASSEHWWSGWGPRALPYTDMPRIPLQEAAGGSYIQHKTWIQVHLVLKAGLEMWF